MNASRYGPLLRTLVISTVALTLVELTARWSLVRWYDRRFPAELVQVDRYGTSNGLVPSRSGTVWGAPFSSDPNGGRTVENTCDTCAYWLHLGDSVAEGVGVDDSSTASSRVARYGHGWRVANLAHIGHSTCDERQVLATWLDTAARVGRVTVVYTLNDVYGSVSAGDLPVPGHHDALAGLRRWLEANCATYRSLKLLLLRRSDSYYRFDAAFYREGEPHFEQAMACLDAIAALCRAHDARLDLLMLPYRSQVVAPGDHVPQRMVAAHCAAAGIGFTDALPAFRDADDPDGLFLFADEIHLSEAGHALVARLLLSS